MRFIVVWILAEDRRGADEEGEEAGDGRPHAPLWRRGAENTADEFRPAGPMRLSSWAARRWATCCRSSTSPTRPTMSNTSGARDSAV